LEPGFAGYKVAATVPESVVALRATTAGERRLRGHVEGGLDHRLARITDGGLRQYADVLQRASHSERTESGTGYGYGQS
jgi:hypothetical protein